MQCGKHTGFTQAVGENILGGFRLPTFDHLPLFMVEKLLLQLCYMQLFSYHHSQAFRNYCGGGGGGGGG